MNIATWVFYVINKIVAYLHPMVMNIKILAFGIAKDIFGGSTINIQLDENATTKQLKTELETAYPRLKQLASYMVAVNNEYADDADVITERDEIAIIPPVSGG
jgi:molybdopterin converting factor subunit 1